MDGMTARIVKRGRQVDLQDGIPSTGNSSMGATYWMPALLTKRRSARAACRRRDHFLNSFGFRYVGRSGRRPPRIRLPAPPAAFRFLRPQKPFNGIHASSAKRTGNAEACAGQPVTGSPAMQAR
jgi:hypothetical protein